MPILETGLPIDRVLGGGIPKGHLILVETEVGAGGGVLTSSILFKRMEKGDFGIIVASDHHPDWYLKMGRYYGFPVDEYFENRFFIINSYSLEGASGYRIWVDPRDLTKLGRNIRMLVEEIRSREKDKNILISLHSASTLMLLNGELETLRFLRMLVPTLKELEVTTFVMIFPDAHDKTTIKTAHLISDGIIQISRGAEPRTGIMRVYWMCGTPYSHDPITLRFEKGKGLEVL